MLGFKKVPRQCRIAVSLLLLAMQATPSFAVEPQPRMWSHLPMDRNFAGIAFAHTDADIAFDPTLKLEDVKMSLDVVAAKYIRSFEAFGKSARVDVTQPFMRGKWSGLLDGSPASTSRQGLGDTFVRFSTNLYGAPPLAGKAFGAYRAGAQSETIVGAGVVFRLPTGDYHSDKLINLGQNRYAIRPQLGVTHSRGPWSAEITGEIGFYGDNDDFFGDKTLSQKPLYIMHAHLIRSFSPGQWLALSMGYDYGGENQVNGVEKNDDKRDTGWKLSYVHPLNRATSVNISYLNIDTKNATGMHSNTLVAALSLAW